MPAASDGVDNASSSPYEIVLELLRATDTSNPFAFELQEQSYVRRLDSGAGRSANFPWRAEVLEHLASIQKENANPAAAAWLGEELRRFLDGLGWSREEENIRGALDVGRPVHITLRLGAAELYALPWEFVPLGATGRPLGSLPGVLLRYEWPGTQTARPDPDPPPEGGRIVFAWSAAGGSVPAAEHLAALRDACGAGHHQDFDPERDVLPHASLGGLREALRAAPTAVLHLLCHGGSLDQAGTAYGLVLDTDDGTGKEIVDARSLQMALADHMSSLRLVVLCACHGGNPGTLDSRLGSVAQALHRAGIPAIVASRYPLSVDASITLAEQLYRGLLAELQSLSAAFIETRTRLRECAARASWASLQLYARAADGPDCRPIVHRPYRGLLVFQSAHARYFHGREAEIDEALRDLSAPAAAHDATKARFLICTGASGAGKSSLVLAGVLPALRKRDGVWAAALMRPHAEWRTQLQALASRLSPGVPTLLVVDQFEEVFTMITSQDEREAFVRALWSLAGDPASGVSVIVTLRVDFLARCGEIRLGVGDRSLEDIAYDSAHRIFIPSMKADHLRKTIEQPAEQVGIVLETGLVEQLLKDAGDEPGALPLLQYTLDQLWQHRRGRQLTWEQYNRLGGVGGALEKQADGMLQRFDGIQQRAARRLFVQLVESSGDARADRRRRVPLDKLRRGSAGETAVFLEVMDAFVHERLLVLSEGDGGTSPGDGGGRPTSDVQSAGSPEIKSPAVEVAHEQLIRSWGTLRSWMQEDRQMLAELQLLDRWVEEARGYTRYLLDGDRLGHARELRKRYPDDISAATRELILRSERAARTKRLANIAITVAAVVAAVAMGTLAFWALRKENDALAAESKARDAQHTAEMQAERARNARLLNNARVLLEKNQPGPATRLLLEVKEPESAPGWIDLAQRALEVGSPKLTFRGHTGAVISTMFSPDGKRVVTASQDGTARVWNADGTGAPVVLGDHGPEVISADFTADGKHIRTVARDGVVRIWKADRNDPPTVLNERVQVVSVDFGPDRNVIYVSAISPDGKRLVTLAGGSAQVKSTDGTGTTITLGSSDSTNAANVAIAAAALIKNNTRTATQTLTQSATPARSNRLLFASPRTAALLRINGSEEQLLSAIFSPDSQRVLTTSSYGNVRLWRANGTGEPILFRGHGDAVISAAFSPDGQYIATASYDLTARVWSINDPTKPIILKGHTRPITSITFSPDGKRIVTSSSDKTVRIWSTNVTQKPLVLMGHEDAVVSAEFSPDGSHIVTASSDQTARLWSAFESHVSVALPGSTRLPFSNKFNRDGKSFLVSPSTSGNGADVWNIDDSGNFSVVQKRAATMSPMAFSPDGSRFVAAGGNNVAQIWRTSGTNAPIILSGHTGPVLYSTFSSDGRRVVTASADKTARIWNADGSGAPIVLSDHTDQVHFATFSADGTKVVTTSTDNTARVWNVDGSGAPVVLTGYTGKVRFAIFSPDGTRVLTVDETPVSGSDTDDKVPQGRVQDRTFKSTGNHDDSAMTRGAAAIAKGKQSGTIISTRVWNANGSGKPLILEGHRAAGEPSTFSPDGKRIVTAFGNAVYVRNVDGSGKPIVFQDDEAEISSTSFSPDGRYIVATSPHGGKVTRWSVDGSGLPLVLRADDPGRQMSHVAFSPDGKRIAAATQQGDAVRLWVVSVDVLGRMLREATSDCLPPQVRRRYLDESEAEARTHYETCESSRERAPSRVGRSEGEGHATSGSPAVAASAPERVAGSGSIHPLTTGTAALSPPSGQNTGSAIPTSTSTVSRPPASSSAHPPAPPGDSSKPPVVIRIPGKTGNTKPGDVVISAAGATANKPGQRPPPIRIPRRIP
ncbi:CHAT domain-containing protein [Sorangium cellulosum]|uniref:nSTAND1 domain-containing NTPase n=1 Tax=Sorangium cellulosum TaxID=56 RepID=UPI003D9A512D